MTLNEIMVAALQRLDRGSDPQTIKAYRPVFTTYANKAVKRIALKFKQCKKEILTLDSDSSFDVLSLSHDCFKVVEVRAGGAPVDFWQDPPGSGLFVVNTKESSVSVVYQYAPKALSSTSDTPEIPSFLHDIIPYYIVACERAGGDPDTQGTASADFQLFNEQLDSMVRETRGEPRSYRLLNF